MSLFPTVYMLPSVKNKKKGKKEKKKKKKKKYYMNTKGVSNITVTHSHACYNSIDD